MSDGALDRVVALGDEWMPEPGGQPRGAGRAHRRPPAAGRGGRPRADPRDGSSAAKPEARAVERLRDVGVDAALFYLPTEDADEAERRLDQLADVAAEVRGG